MKKGEESKAEEVLTWLIICLIPIAMGLWLMLSG